MKYPSDIISYVRQKTFSIEAKFTKETNESPLKVFDHFSRFVVCVINKGKAATFNLPIDSLSEIESITNYCHTKQLDHQCATTVGGTTPAYTVRFNMGKLKGKTPIEVLIEDPENGKKVLNEQYAFYKQNVEKFPANKAIMDAIVDASRVDLSNIKIDTPVSMAPITILDIGSRPLIRKTREDGKCLCYEANITWDFTKKYPVTCVIKNYFAPVVKTNEGLLNVQLKNKDTESEIINDFSMTAAEWLNAVRQMTLSKEAFYITNFTAAYKLAEGELEKHRRTNDVAV